MFEKHLRKSEILSKDAGRLTFWINSKMYSFLVDDNSEHEKAKGINRNVVAKKNKHNEYKDVLKQKKVYSIRLIESKVKTIE